MSHLSYRLREDTVYDEEEKSHLVYGIELANERGEIEACFPDLFCDRQKAKEFVSLCNQNQLSPIHLLDVIEDLLGQN